MFRCAILMVLVISSCRLSLTGSAGVVKAYPILPSNGTLYEQQVPSLVPRQTTDSDATVINGIQIEHGVIMKWSFQSECRSLKSGCPGRVISDRLLNIQFFMKKRADTVFEVLGGFLDSEGEQFRALAYVHSDYIERPKPELQDPKHDTIFLVEKQRKQLGKVGQLLAYGKVTPPGSQALECTIIKDPRFITYSSNSYRTPILPTIADNYRAEIDEDSKKARNSIVRTDAMQKCEHTMKNAYNDLLLPALKRYIKKYGVVPLPNLSHVVFPRPLDRPGRDKDVVFLFDQSWTSLDNREDPRARIEAAQELARQTFVDGAAASCSKLRQWVRSNPNWPNVIPT